ncbi:hypothetical protein EVAR_84095_1 [Eumeta japonica]|uniref:Mos1 transposase HTH domain-containing protein n=1 Tax=Eumeta variegata TaxID=151549 RepID=A0A4C1UZJ2_EUMVA|nr:hypothetical protein EVAR_84095_1 [Eumeta japonica]
MDLTRENFRALIYYHFRRGLTQKQCINQLTSTFGDEASSKTIVYHWFSEFNRKRSMLTDEFKESRPKIILHHDNASCHMSAETTLFLEGQKIELTGHPLYSPDLAPNDFYPLPSVKNKLRGYCYSSREEVVDAFKMHVLEIPQSEWKKCYKN